MMQTDIAVKGAGVVGKTLALALARQGFRISLMGDPNAKTAACEPKSVDVRAYALNASSRRLLQQLKVWDALPKTAVTPVFEMRVAGDAPGAELTFSAWQQGVEVLAWIVGVQALEQALSAALQFAPHVTQQPLDGNIPTNSLVAVCEGKASATRMELNVAVRQDRYGQWAIAARLLTEFTHNGAAHQWFGCPDVLALLPTDSPQPGHTVALVWSVPEARAEQLLALPSIDFEQALFQASGGKLGQLTLISQRSAWSLERSSATCWCGPGWVLLGDAAHGVHPLAGQGLNLGLADVACLAQVLSEREPWRALGDEKLLRRYSRARAAPTWAMSEAIDGLWQLFAARSTCVQQLRNRGLTLVNHLPPLKRKLVEQALGLAPGLNQQQGLTCSHD
jgi:2-polyprenyl-6-methoxyphenol hydroxylase-like FAD-dependent oxidoreductase